jgi:hypothetical protein
MKKHIFVLLVPLLFLMAKCQEPQVDPPKHVNKFTCKVNGVLWEAVSRDRAILGNDLEASDDPLGRIYIQAFNTTKSELIGFTFLPTDTSNTVVIPTENPFSAAFSLSCGNYRIDTTKVRQVTILEHDKIKLIIKGRFQFSAADKENICGKVTVTDGYFDLRYQ